MLGKLVGLNTDCCFFASIRDWAGRSTPDAMSLLGRPLEEHLRDDLPAAFMSQERQHVVVMHAKQGVLDMNARYIPDNRYRVDGVPWRWVRFGDGRSDDADETLTPFPFQPALEVPDAAGFLMHCSPKFRGIVLAHALDIGSDDVGNLCMCVSVFHAVSPLLHLATTHRRITAPP